MSTELSYWGRRVPRRSLLVAGGSAAFLTACGGSNNSKNAASKSTAANATSATAPAAAGSATVVTGIASLAAAAASAAAGSPVARPGKPGGMLRSHLPKEPGNLDPHLATDSSTTAFADLAYNSLLRLKTGANVEVQDVQLEGELADKWEMPDPQTVVLHIRPDVKWQNKAPLNGRAFTAEDAKWGVLRIGTDKPEFQRATFFKGIDKIDVTDANTIVIRQKEPNVPFLTYLAVPYHKMLPREVIEKEGDAKNMLIGTGPFILDSFTRGRNRSDHPRSLAQLRRLRQRTARRADQAATQPRRQGGAQEGVGRDSEATRPHELADRHGAGLRVHRLVQQGQRLAGAGRGPWLLLSAARRNLVRQIGRGPRRWPSRRSGRRAATAV